MKVIKRYSDNLDEPTFESLLLILKDKYNQTLDYYDACAKRMGRYARKNKPLKDWPSHIRNKYYFVVNAHNEAIPKSVFTT